VTTSTYETILPQLLSFKIVLSGKSSERKTNKQFLIETENLSPNIPDPNSYTPMHASASYAHTDILEYLISVGGDINLRDDDGDTPLYVVESVEMARWMIERGAQWGVVNEEGLSVSQSSLLLLQWMLDKLGKGEIPLGGMGSMLPGVECFGGRGVRLA
jgi:ankyrin repeat protein